MKIWECRDLGDTQEFLCMCIVKSKGCIKIDQVDYLHKVLQRFNLFNVKAPPTPLPEGYQPHPSTSPTDPELCLKFQQVIGSLLYIECTSDHQTRSAGHGDTAGDRCLKGKAVTTIIHAPRH